MDKTSIKNFAVGARRKLKEQIEQKAYALGITNNEAKKPVVHEDTFDVNGNKYSKRVLKHRDSLISRINEKGYNQVIEEVAYTWFNRLIAIRFMEVNEYLPTGVRLLSSTEPNKAEPDVIREVLNIDLDLNQDLVYRLQDENKTEELYKYILIKQCNELGKIMPVVFEEIEDYTELLLPDNLLQEGSIIRDLVISIQESDWKEQVEIIGWLYQYYISEKKDEVFADLKKNQKITKENIPAATQLFTPDWIVKYMVENSLGRLWLESHPDEELKSKWRYYLEEAEQEPEVMQQLRVIRNKNKDLKPEDIKVIDCCMGSGHVLVYCMDVLYDIYKSAGYSEREIPKLILEENLYGLDIDDRAAQLAYFAVMMKARSYNRRILKERIDLNICSIQESNGIPKEAADYLISPKDTELEKRIHKEDLEYLLDIFIDAKEYGSIVDVKPINFDVIERRIEEIKNGITINIFELQYKNMILDKVPSLIKQAKIMSQKYDCAVTNPPYMGRKGMNDKLTDYIDAKYKNSKLDMFSVFIEKCNDFCKSNRYLSMITQQSWMFLSSYSNFRKQLFNDSTISTMIHLGPHAFEEIGGEVVQTTSFTFQKMSNNKYYSKYVRLINYDKSSEKEYEFFNKKNHYVSKIENYRNMPGEIVSYWLSQKVLDVFNNELFNKNFITEGQNKTGNNDRFLRYFWEIDNNSIGTDKRWLFYAKGGGFRRWAGNLYNVIDWSEKARVHYRKDKVCRLIPEYLWYKKGITWGLITTNSPSFRILPTYATFDVTGTSIFFNDYTDYNYYLGLLNSKVSTYLLGIINPTVSLQLVNVGSLPIKKPSNPAIMEQINELVRENTRISEYDWDSFENSWNFKVHPIIEFREGNKTIKGAVDNWSNFVIKQFNRIKKNEETLNRIFIDMYGLNEELSESIEENNVTIRNVDIVSDVKSFISYAIGCMYGRYSLDDEGIIYAGGEFNHQRYKTFKVDLDNVIPITDDEYFEDDIVSRFIEFVKIVFSEETLEENIDFIADILGKKGNETSRQTIRRYFIKDFYKDHLQTYQKKPIYWLFDSGKNDGFKALIYMHRYDIGNVARVRTDYLHLLQRKYEAEVNRLDIVMESNASTREKNEARKKKEKIQKQIEECKQYDQVIAHVANQKISIDLDDGVSVNYAKFQGVEVPQGEGKKPLKADLLAKV